MIVDLATATTPAPDYDVCIVGSGPAGMTAARELSEAPLRICVLESGRLKTTELGDRLRKVKSDGIVIKDYSRERVLGGASTTWAGLSSPLDEIDMNDRPYLQHSGWPIRRSELFEYYAIAAERYRFPTAAEFESGGFDTLRAQSQLQPRWTDIHEKVFLASSEPQNFGKEHKQIFERENVNLYLDATVLRLETNKNRSDVERAVVRTSAGQEFNFHAKIFIIATGGIENARLLLMSRDACDRGLGNEHDAVGRYFMNHPKNYYGVLTLTKAVTDAAYYFGCIRGSHAGYAGLRLQESIQRERKLLNSYVRFEPLFPWSGSTGVESLVTIVKRSKFVMSRFKGKNKGKVITLRDYSETGDDSDLQNERKTAASWLGLGWNVLADSPRVARYGYSRLLQKRQPKITTVRLRNFMEMEPVAENRVILTNERDVFGSEIPLVRHRATELDRRSIVALHQTLQKEFPASGLGTFITDLPSIRADEPWPLDQDASHHMGTTRMGGDPATSVVDSNCRVHSAKNLYMAGASVFPTSGCANPTFTITALSIRLAKHLLTEVFKTKMQQNA
ncbi:MAG: FAD-dependent oxidoreductase [Planctomycetota bacterium]